LKINKAPQPTGTRKKITITTKPPPPTWSKAKKIRSREENAIPPEQEKEDYGIVKCRKNPGKPNLSTINDLK
jgi:hypothetical protein